MARWMVGGGVCSLGSARSSAASTRARRSARYAWRSKPLTLPLPAPRQTASCRARRFVLRQDLDALFGLLQILRAPPRERDPLLEHPQRLLERQVAALQLAH